jgi:bZIP transcription factor
MLNHFHFSSVAFVDVLISLLVPPIRSERNREHAKRSRLRKKSFTESLEHSLAELRDENETLRSFVYTKLGGTKKEADIIIQKQIDETVYPFESNQFLMNVMKPENHILNDATQALLQKLSKKIQFPEGCPIAAIG